MAQSLLKVFRLPMLGSLFYNVDIMLHRPSIAGRKNKLLVVIDPQMGLAKAYREIDKTYLAAILRGMSNAIRHVLTERDDFDVCIVGTFCTGAHRERIPFIVENSFQAFTRAARPWQSEISGLDPRLNDVLSLVTFFTNKKSDDVFANPRFVRRVEQSGVDELYFCGFFACKCVYDSATGDAGGKEHYKRYYLPGLSGPNQAFDAELLSKYAAKGVEAVYTDCLYHTGPKKIIRYAEAMNAVPA